MDNDAQEKPYGYVTFVSADNPADRLEAVMERGAFADNKTVMKDFIDKLVEYLETGEKN